MAYEVNIVADSVGPTGARITTFQLKYPRMIHSELLTHRMFSRNASSTRAIPTAKMIEWIEKDPAMPVYWGKNQQGMQATQELSEPYASRATEVWLKARDQAVRHAKTLTDIGVHKQIASRILEPWAHINVVLTATDFNNFFTLRCHPAAMPEIQVLAVQMARAYRASKPVHRQSLLGWHIPFVTPDELTDNTLVDCLKFSVARCARVSYLTFEGKQPDLKADIRLHDMLASNGHWSPFEHQAECSADSSRRSGNFRGWVQYRERFPEGVFDSFDFATLNQFGERDFVV